MRALLAAALLALPAPAPALAFDAESYANEIYALRHRVEADRAEHHQAAEARQKALCAKLGGVRIGLNADGVLRSCWGKPARRNVTTTASHTEEQWVYNTGYVYLTDGVVTAIQAAR